MVYYRYYRYLSSFFPPTTDIPTYYRYQQKRYTRMRYTRPKCYEIYTSHQQILISTEKMLSLTKIDLKVYKGNPHLLHVLSQTIVQVLDRFGSNIIFLNRMKDLWSTGRPLGTSLMTLDRKRAVWAIYGSFSVFDKYFT
ncbi:uncharacterized protein LOC143852635 isoform X2 [Tasmannia lanceolata]|uniref:uncharacterized protein LOC143852635 isoform X2 n=1 Tax=Tasmannia lanceolata TaxID=3420 RepID=UPI004064368F